MANPDLMAIAQRVRRQTTNMDVLALCDAYLALASRPAAPERVVERERAVSGCPVCAARREARTASQRRRRGKRGAEKADGVPAHPVG